MRYQDYIEITAGKRGGKPCLVGMRITVGDVLGWLANGLDEEAILADYPELTQAHIRACLAFAAESSIQNQEALIAIFDHAGHFP